MLSAETEPTSLFTGITPIKYSLKLFGYAEMLFLMDIHWYVWSSTLKNKKELFLKDSSKGSMAW